MRYPQAIQNLIEKLSSLPSVGPKTAERYVFYLLKKSNNDLQELAQAIAGLKDSVTICHSCRAITESNPCTICRDKNRQQNILCLVENTPDYLAIETTQQYTGKYFILGGLINTIDNIRPEDLKIKQLLKKLKTENITEVILALNFTLEGETTALYLKKILKDYRLTRLAKGLPAGSDLEYADKLTLASALKNRNELK